MVRLRCFSSLAAVAVAGVLVGACSSAPESVGQASEALAPVCPASGCGLDLCATNTSCEALSKDTPGYDLPWIINGADCEQPAGFSDGLTALGCKPEFYYAAVAGVNRYQAMAICPSVPALTRAVLCDTCTGRPPVGWTVVTWDAQSEDPCASPSGGCHSNVCRVN